MTDENMVEVRIRIPKNINNFVNRLAALEGSSPEAWYRHWISQGFLKLEEANFTISPNSGTVRETYDLQVAA